MSGPLSRSELSALETMARGQMQHSGIEELVLGRLLSLGLAEERRGVWSVTARGKMNLQRRKALLRSAPRRPGPG